VSKEKSEEKRISGEANDIYIVLKLPNESSRITPRSPHRAHMVIYVAITQEIFLHNNFITNA